jgi:hypothetical protein
VMIGEYISLSTFVNDLENLPPKYQ